jgi:hypothetical protein
MTYVVLQYNLGQLNHDIQALLSLPTSYRAIFYSFMKQTRSDWS